MSFNEKLSYTEHNVVSPTSDFTIGFEDYALTTKDRINVTVDDVDAKDAGYTVTRKNNLVVTLTPPVPSGVVRLQRETNIDTPFHRFTAGAKFVATNVDQNFTQILHSQQEVRNLFGFTQDYIQRALDNFDLRIQGVEGIVLDLRQDYINLDKRITKEVGDRKQGDQALKDYIDSTVNGITGENFLPIHDSFVTTESGRTQRDKNKEVPSIDDFETLAESIDFSKANGLQINGVHKTIESQEVPNLIDFKNTNFLKSVTGGALNYPTVDYLRLAKHKITQTTDYTSWAQDKCFEYNGVIYAPFQMSTQHTAVGQRIAWSRSFDKGNTWTAPEVILDKAVNPTRGWNCFCMGESGGRLYAVMEWRTDTSTDDTEFYLYSRPLDRTRQVTGGISKQASETEITVVISDHGLIAGDNIFFTGVGVSGISGKVTVLSAVDKDTFKVAANTTTIPMAINNAGQTYYCAVEFASNEWQRQLITSSMIIGTTSKVTHIHSFANVDGNSFIVGFGFGGTTADPTRQVGYFHVQNIHGLSATLTKYRINAADEASSTEPCVIYDSSENRVYLTTRNQGQNSYACVTRSVLNSGVWETIKLPFKSIFCNLPIVKMNSKLYIFGTERGSNAFIDGSTNYISKGVQDVATYLYEINNWDSTSLKASVLTYDIHGGDSSVAGTGVGSAIHAFGKLMYFYGSESADSQHLYGTNSASQDARSHLNNNGFQPDIMLLTIELDKRVAVTEFDLIGYDSIALPLYRDADNVRVIDTPLRFNYAIRGDMLFRNTVNTVIGNETQSGSDTNYLVVSSNNSNDSNRGAWSAYYGANHATAPNRAVTYAPKEYLINTPLLGAWSHNTTDIGTSTVRFKTAFLRNLNVNNLSVFADNTAAKSGGLVVGDIYRTSTGALMVVY